eukprot:Nitzschia sp. Nitz4//scaffold23_size168460//118028//119659//NITZ4_002235-RA/size168460-processed-gene-0.231-mRNA-1//1//CDS//3329543683//425//frame0
MSSNHHDHDNYNEEEDLNSILQGDDFLTEEQREEQRAKERRLARKRRLQALEAESSSNVVKTTKVDPPPAPAKDTTTTAATATATTATAADNHTTTLSITQEKKEPLSKNIADTDIQASKGDDDEYDMFSSSVSPPLPQTTPSLPPGANNQSTEQRQQDWDDVEGYYRATIGELIHLDLPNQQGANVQFRMAGVIGKGVFSTVLKCTTESSTLSEPQLPPQVALKFIRHNDTMAKAAVQEIRFLQRFQNSPGIVSLLLPNDNAPLEYRGHTILVFPFLKFNLRDVLSKYGKSVGLSLPAVRSYFSQLLAAGWQLERHKIIHSDLKPDNILVSADFQTIYLADFGSAVDPTEGIEMAPYLVSRFYRAPEIILGLTPTYAIDLWSLAVTAVELFLGKILFRGINNNDMIHVMMEQLGPCPNRLIRQHLVQTKKFPLTAHFTPQIPYTFCKLTEDPVTHTPVRQNIPLHHYTTTTTTNNNNNNNSSGGSSPSNLTSLLVRAKTASDSKATVLQFANLLHQCLHMDPTKRADCKTALQHAFFQSNYR